MPTNIPMPTTTIWDQYAVAAIVFVVFIVLMAFAWRAFTQYRTWQTQENLQQRTWYEAMEKKRDESQGLRDLKWQQFYQQIQDHQARRDRDNNEVLSKLISRIDMLTETLTVHDRKSAERADRIESVANGAARKRRAA
ncbi:MAG: hypothetical protein WC837_04435 [Bellilinea sp.]